MKLTINGKAETVEANGEGLSVVELLARKDVQMPDMVSVQVNGQILNREEFETRQVREDDQVEFLYFMGGGRR